MENVPEVATSQAIFVEVVTLVRIFSRERLRKKIYLNSSATKKFYVDLLNGSLNLGPGLVTAEEKLPA